MGDVVAIHPDHLRASASAPDASTARRCAGCGYILTGLPRGARCPECGLPSLGPTKIDDPLSSMPPRIVRAFRMGCWLASLCVAGAVVVALLSLRWQDRTALGGGLATAWIVASWLLTPAYDAPQAVFHGFARRSTLRRLARLMSPGWLLVVGALAVRDGAAKAIQASPALEPLVIATIVAALAVAVTGSAALVLMMKRLADWTRDRDAEAALNLALWGIPSMSLLSVIDVPVLGLATLLALVWTASVGALPYGLLSLSVAVSWAVRHSSEHQERERRRQERHDDYDREVAERLQRMEGKGRTPR
jgi:hypothetical protein